VVVTRFQYTDQAGLELLVIPLFQPLKCWDYIPNQDGLYIYFLLIYLFYVYECFACISVCAPYACLVSMEIRREISDSLVLEVQIVVSNHVGAGN
jgi:formate hydrogenlyase subunit 4